MIIHIAESPGDHCGGLVTYMAGPGHGNEHTSQRTIAGGTVHYGALDRETTRQVAADLQAYQAVHPDVKVTGGSVWHCSMSVEPDQGPISDAQWSRAARDLMEGLGFVGDTKPDVRWAIFGHGESVNGNPHCHIVMSRVTATGTKVNTYRDMVKAQELAPSLEAQMGVRVLQSRLAGVGGRGYSQQDARIARDHNLPEPRQVECERRVRALAGASQSEAEFVRLCRADGLLLKPWVKDGRVGGWRVGVPALPGEKQVTYTGSELGRDLTLPALRRSWPDGGGSRAVALAEWQTTTPTITPEPHAPLVPTLTAEAAAEQLNLDAARIQVADGAEFTAISHDLAGVLAAASEATEARPGTLAAASRDVGRWAQGRHKPTQARFGVGAAALFLTLTQHPELAETVMLRMVVTAVLDAYAAHRAARPAMVMKGMRMTEGDGVEDLVESAVPVAVVGGVTVHTWRKRRAGGDREGDLISDGQEGMDVRGSTGASWTELGPVSAEQMARIEELSAVAGVPLVAEAAEVYTAAEAEEMIAALEASTTPGWSEAAEENVVRDTAVASPEKNQEAAVDKHEAAQSAAKNRSQLDRPETWASGGERITGPQKYTLKEAGYDTDKVASMTKAQASRVISPLSKGDKAGADRAWEFYEASSAASPDAQALQPNKAKHEPVKPLPQQRKNAARRR